LPRCGRRAQGRSITLASSSLLTSFNPPLRWGGLKRHEQSSSRLGGDLVPGCRCGVLGKGSREGQGPGPDSGAGVGSVARGVGQKVRSPELSGGSKKPVSTPPTVPG
jgi:hypothetical protein